MNLLVIDDSRVARLAIRRALRHAGRGVLQLLEADDGEAGLQLLRERPVDLVLCDWQMPGMDGLEFLRQKTEDPAIAGIPVVMVTAEGSPARMREARLLGARFFLRKPLSPEHLQQAIAAAAGR